MAKEKQQAQERDEAQADEQRAAAEEKAQYDTAKAQAVQADEQDKALEDASVDKTDAGAPDTSGEASPFVAFAKSAVASTGEQVEVPKTPQEIAEQGSKLGADGDYSTGGNVNPPSGGSVDGPVYARVWAMDADQTVGNRHLPDTFKPDCSVRVS